MRGQPRDVAWVQAAVGLCGLLILLAASLVAGGGLAPPVAGLAAAGLHNRDLARLPGGMAVMIERSARITARAVSSGLSFVTDCRTM